MSRYSVRVDINHKKVGVLPVVEEYDSHDKAARSYTLWKELVSIPETAVTQVSFIQHKEEETLYEHRKTDKPKPATTNVVALGASNAHG